MMVMVAWVFRRSRPSRVDKWFRRLQLVSAGAYSLGHGGNDAQKTIGIIWMLLIATGYMWLRQTNRRRPGSIVSCYMAIGAGTMFGGWRIVKTMGQKITKLKPVGGFCAETGGALTLFLATALGIPVSTTHTITGAIVGVGSAPDAPVRCAGVWRAISCGHGCSPFRPAHLWPRLLTGSVLRFSIDVGRWNGRTCVPQSNGLLH
jgi:PiT family inorganic phosphate transporter